MLDEILIVMCFCTPDLESYISWYCNNHGTVLLYKSKYLENNLYICILDYHDYRLYCIQVLHVLNATRIFGCYYLSAFSQILNLLISHLILTCS